MQRDTAPCGVATRQRPLHEGEECGGVAAKAADELEAARPGCGGHESAHCGHEDTVVLVWVTDDAEQHVAEVLQS